jgi:hypothetical protein
MIILDLLVAPNGKSLVALIFMSVGGFWKPSLRNVSAEIRL